MEVDGTVLDHIVEVTTSDSFKKLFSVLAVKLRYFLECLMEVHTLPARCTYNIMKEKADVRSKILKESMFARNLDLILKEIGTEEV